MSKIDKFGRCPKCKTNWNGGDIYQYLRKMSMFMHLTDREVMSVAENYGWTQYSPKSFSLPVTHEIKDKVFIQCSEVMCSTIFDVETGKEYDSLYQVYRTAFKTPTMQEVAEEYIDKNGILELVDEELLKEMEAYTKIIEITKEKIHDTLGMSEDQLGKIESSEQRDERRLKEKFYAEADKEFKKQENATSNTTGSFSKFREVLRKAKK